MAKPRHDGRIAERSGEAGTRTCVGCRGEASKSGLIRVVRKAEGGAAIDLTGSAAGRGAYVHADTRCVDLARKRKALDRALGTTIQPGLWPDLIK